MKADIPLFSYGTLQLREVQMANYGRPLEGSPDALAGYRLEVLPDRDPDAVRISGSNTHMVVRRTGNPADRVPGAVPLLTPKELAATDKYEGSDYGRAELMLESGRPRWSMSNRTPDPPRSRPKPSTSLAR